MSEKNKRHVACKYVNYVEHLFWTNILASTVTDSIFASIVCVAVGITSSLVWIKICVITAGIKKCKLIIKKKKKRHG